MIRDVQVYMEQPGNRWTPDRQRRYWRQSSEAESAGNPYISIRPRGRHARVVCDWITAGRRPPALFSHMTAAHLARCWPEVRVKYLGSYTVIARVPLSQAEPIAEDIAALAAIAMRTVGHC